MGRLSVKKKEEQFMRNIVVFACVFTDSSVASSPNCGIGAIGGACDGGRGA